jgi:hypothetical protein
MGRCVIATSIFGILCLFPATAPTFAAQTCTERQQVCFAYCEKTYNNAPKCTEACKNYLATCLSTGCWESRVTAKRCGFSKQ